MPLYRHAKEPFKVGSLRTKTWRTLETNLAQDDPKWNQRCSQYWSLQERLFGVRMSQFVMVADNSQGFVSTYSAVLGVLPGERTHDKTLVPVEAANLPSVA